MTLVSPSKKVFDDSLTDLGGGCLFDPSGKDFAKAFPFLRRRADTDWNTFGRRFYGFDKEPIYVRFVNPCHERFGSIARVVQPSYRYYSWSQRTASTSDQIATMKQWNAGHGVSAELNWDKRSSRPSLYSYGEEVEFLPDYEGPTVWAFDRERKKRVEHTPALDRLGRELNVGDFIVYILYQFDGSGAAGIYFGNVTKVEVDGSVWAKNVGLTTKSRVAEKKIKDNNLITILTDDLMRQLMMAKLSNA